MKQGWLFGIGATPAEKALAYALGAAGVGLVVWQARDLDWTWWQYAVGGLVAFDLAGGVIANARRSKLNRHPIGFTAAHVQPVLIGLLFGAAWWGLLWYAWALVGVLLVSAVPRSVARPVAFLVVVLGTFVGIALTAPPAFEWLPTILLLKLVLAHAVPPEEAS